MNKYLVKIAEMRERKFPKAKSPPLKSKLTSKTKLKTNNPAKPKNVVLKKENLVSKSKIHRAKRKTGLEAS